MLLDRSADVFLAQRSAAEGWLIKPLDAIRLRRALRTVIGGGTYTEGVPGDQPVATGLGCSGPPGSGAAWLARSVRDAEVAGSNPAFPTDSPSAY